MPFVPCGLAGGAAFKDARFHHLPRVPQVSYVKFREMVYRVFREILYTLLGKVLVSMKRSTIVERFIAGSSSRTRVAQ